MKLIALFAAGAIAAGAVVATPAEAQRHGGRHGGHQGGYHGGYNGHHGSYRGHYRGGHYGYRGGYYRGGYGYRGGYARGRDVCRIHRGYYGPVRRCVRVFR